MNPLMKTQYLFTRQDHIIRNIEQITLDIIWALLQVARLEISYDYQK